MQGAGPLLKPTVPAPPASELSRLLAEHAPLRPAPLCPELQVFHARSLVEVWQAAEAMAGATLPAPFWAYPWPGGSALARLVLDRPELVRGRNVIDFGAGGGVTALAAARAGGTVTANDVDPWAVAVAGLAAGTQGLQLQPLIDDLCATPQLVDDFDVVLCSDLAYERSETPRQRSVLERALRNGATVLAADAGRTYFDETGMRLLASFDMAVPHDLEGVPRRTARVYLMTG
ncbi:MAG TPA: methyltransferase domain-containing protein [Longimicrobiales bacterium]|nr:methyltransferase domain-containing protein [Longimicrobiales bacterium]